MTDVTTDIDLAAYQGKKVTFQLKLETPAEDGSTSVEIEGLVELVNGPAMIVKPKGSAMTKLIELRNIVSGSLAQVVDKPRELKARRIDPISLTNSRYHLLDRHGYRLEVVNRMSDEQAYREHEGLDHDELGHFHAVRGADEVAE